VAEISPDDIAAVEQFARDLEALQGRTQRQVAWLRIRQGLDRGEYTAAERAVLCTCHAPHCVVHGEMPPGRNLRTAPEGGAR
jgi:hypothetical protein